MSTPHPHHLTRIGRANLEALHHLYDQMDSNDFVRTILGRVGIFRGMELEWDTWSEERKRIFFRKWEIVIDVLSSIVSEGEARED